MTQSTSLLSLPPEILIHHVLLSSPDPSSFPPLSPIDISNFSKTCKFSYSLIYGRLPERSDDGIDEADDDGGSFWRVLFLEWFDDPKDGWEEMGRIFDKGKDAAVQRGKDEMKWNWKREVIRRVECIKFVRMGEGDERKYTSLPFVLSILLSILRTSSPYSSSSSPSKNFLYLSGLFPPSSFVVPESHDWMTSGTRDGELDSIANWQFYFLREIRVVKGKAGWEKVGKEKEGQKKGKRRSDDDDYDEDEDDDDGFGVGSWRKKYDLRSSDIIQKKDRESKEYMDIPNRYEFPTSKKSLRNLRLLREIVGTKLGPRLESFRHFGSTKSSSSSPPLETKSDEEDEEGWEERHRFKEFFENLSVPFRGWSRETVYDLGSYEVPIRKSEIRSLEEEEEDDEDSEDDGDGEMEEEERERSNSREEEAENDEETDRAALNSDFLLPLLYRLSSQPTSNTSPTSLLAISLSSLRAPSRTPRPPARRRISPSLHSLRRSIPYPSLHHHLYTPLLSSATINWKLFGAMNRTVWSDWDDGREEWEGEIRRLGDEVRAGRATDKEAEKKQREREEVWKDIAGYVGLPKEGELTDKMLEEMRLLLPVGKVESSRRGRWDWESKDDDDSKEGSGLESEKKLLRAISGGGAERKKIDWAGVEGRWLGTYAFVDYREFHSE